ncbi:MAG TPA: acylphosphatase [Candidatus Cottocaccamicrobium excrementipullorum]|nr:acylphosphatase [Candidatus Cottocaccamicrobium excrementipullorum]
MVRKHYRFHGRVQGVGFRYKAMYLARGLGLTGWVENQWDGTVEMEVQGKPETIERLLSRLQEDRYISIAQIEESDRPLEKERSFQVKG